MFTYRIPHKSNYCSLLKMNAKEAAAAAALERAAEVADQDIPQNLPPLDEELPQNVPEEPLKGDWPKFRAAVAVYINDNNRDVTPSHDKALRKLFQNIRKDADENPNRADSNTDTDESFIDAEEDVNPGDPDPRENVLPRPERKALAHAFCVIFRESFHKLTNADKNFYLHSILRHLDIPKQNWGDFHIHDVN